MKHPPVTEDSILAALKKAGAKMRKDPAITSTEQTAGFILPDGQTPGQCEGVQVFVKVYRYSQPLLKAEPLTGGLLANAK